MGQDMSFDQWNPKTAPNFAFGYPKLSRGGTTELYYHLLPSGWAFWRGIMEMQHEAMVYAVPTYRGFSKNAQVLTFRSCTSIGAVTYQ